MSRLNHYSKVPIRGTVQLRIIPDKVSGVAEIRFWYDNKLVGIEKVRNEKLKKMGYFLFFLLAILNVGLVLGMIIFIRIWFWGEHQISSDFSQFPPTDNPK